MKATAKPMTGIFAALILPLLAVQIGWCVTFNLPPYVEFTALLDSPPETGKPLTIRGEVKALVGNIENAVVSLIPPIDWIIPEPVSIPRVASGSTNRFEFQLIPPKPIPNASIVCKVSLDVPKTALLNHYSSLLPDHAEAFGSKVDTMPDRQEFFCDIAFALFEEEGFYPLSDQMWMDYDDRLKPSGAIKGAVFYRNGLISVFQAQTDVDMFEKLQASLDRDPALEKQLTDSGIDLAKKRHDRLLGLYVLATEAYSKGSFEAAEALLEKYFKAGEMPIDASEGSAFTKNTIGSRYFELELAAKNLNALCKWAAGERRKAETILRNCFYENRKAALQRYILRNLGLLMLDTSDQATAREMFRLALQIKPEYSLLKKEFEALKTN